MSERHAFIVPGVSREAFEAVGIRLTGADGELSYYLHSHAYDPFGQIVCNDSCQVVREGEVHYVTRLEDTKP